CQELVGPEDKGGDALHSIKENRLRLAMRPIDQARHAAEAIEQGKTRADIMDETGMSPSTLSEYLGALELPAEWIDKIEKGADLTRTYREYWNWQDATKETKQDYESWKAAKTGKKTYHSYERFDHLDLETGIWFAPCGEKKKLPAFDKMIEAGERYVAYLR